MKKNRINKTCVIQARCTKSEEKELNKRALESGLKRSDYIRAKCLMDGRGKEKHVPLVVKATELLNYLEENGFTKIKPIERMVDDLWNLL